MSNNFEEWREEKKRKGEWLSDEEYRQKRKRVKEWREEKKRKGEWLPYEEYLLEQKKDTLKNHETILNIKDEEIIIKREVIFDTETTGLSDKDKIVEISFIEVIDGVKTGRSYQTFFNPLIRISKKACEIHKITNEDVKDAPLFREKAEEIIRFIGTSSLVAHNATFDMKFLNRELIHSGWHPYPKSRFIDTVKIARFLFCKEKNRLDDLCDRFKIDNHNRIATQRHSAHEDTVLLYHVYIKLCDLLKEKNLSPYDFKLE